MPQVLTNYDAEICNGILKIPPNCAKLTKGEKRRALTGFYKLSQSLGHPFPEWAGDIQQRHTFTKRGPGRPDVHVFVSRGPSFKSDVQTIKEHLEEAFGLLGALNGLEATFSE